MISKDHKFIRNYKNLKEEIVKKSVKYKSYTELSR